MKMSKSSWDKPSQTTTLVQKNIEKLSSRFFRYLKRVLEHISHNSRFFTIFKSDFLKLDIPLVHFLIGHFQFEKK
jgi:hypothetical protein